MRAIYSVFIYILMGIIIYGAYLVVKTELIRKKNLARPMSSSRLLREYEDKLEQLNQKKTSFEQKLEKNPDSFRESQKTALIKLAEDINDLEAAIVEWRDKKDTDEWTKTYDLCKLIYDDASKICRSLSEDTMLGQ